MVAILQFRRYVLLQVNFAEVGAEFQRLHSMSATERMNDLYTTIERPNGQLMEHQRKMLNVLFRVFAQNFRCVSSYIPKVYTGKMRVFDCESAIANFFLVYFLKIKRHGNSMHKESFYLIL